MIPEGGGIGRGCKNAKAHLLALELLLKIKRSVCVCRIMQGKTIVPIHSFHGKITTT